MRKQIATIEPDILESILSDVVLSKYHISRDDINRKSRFRDIVEPRQIWHHVYFYFTELSLSKIGRMVGFKNHATVLHSKKVIDNLISTDKKMKRFIKDLHKRIIESEIMSLEDIISKVEYESKLIIGN